MTFWILISPYSKLITNLKGGFELRGGVFLGVLF